MKRVCFLIMSLVMPVLVFAQDQTGGAGQTTAGHSGLLLPGAGYFFAALVAGVILAIAFHLILTNLSVAAGLNMLAGVTGPKRYAKGRDKDQHQGKDDDTVADSVQKISSAFGIWTLVTASLALFAASWVAGVLTMANSWVVGAVLGLTIWGLFYVATMTIEVNAVSSLVGTLGRLALTGLRTAFNGVASVFAKSEETKAANTAAKVVSAVKEEMFGDMDMKDVSKQLEKFVERMTPPKIDPSRIRRELAKLLDETEIRAIAQHDGAYLDRDTIVAELRTKGLGEADIKSVVSGVQDAFAKIKEEASSTNKDTTSKVADAAMRVAGLSPDEARSQREKLENYLRSTGKEELNPEGIKRDIEKLFSNRREGMEALKSRFASVDRDTVVTVLAQRKDMTREEAEHIVDQIGKVLNQVGSVVSSTSSSATSMKDGIVAKLRNYFNSLERPELEYEGLEHDFRLLFSDPKEGADALLNRLKAVDRNTIKAIIASRKDMSEEDAERIVSRVEGMRDQMVAKAQQMKDEVARRLEAAKEEAIHQADQVREVAATAAWWAFGTAVVSGIAATLGGILAAGAL